MCYEKNEEHDHHDQHGVHANESAFGSDIAVVQIVPGNAWFLDRKGAYFDLLTLHIK